MGFRNTYAEINVRNLCNNVQSIINFYNEYKYYIGVVKADNYGHGNIESVNAVIKGGCNYLAVATLDEAMFIREHNKTIPILCLGSISYEFIDVCIKNNITITIHSLEYMKELIEVDCTNLKAHIKINTGMNRIGISNYEELYETIEFIKEKNIEVEGIYSHIYNANNKEDYEKQLENFNNMLQKIDTSNIKIIHISASESLVNYKKPDFINGCRLGIIMYGFTTNKDLKLKDTFKVYSEVIQINTLNIGDSLGYNALYKAKRNGQKIAVVSIGYADGIIRKNTGRTVYINNKEYKIVGNVCMDMLFVEIDDNVKLHDKVEILKDIKHIEDVSEHLDTIPYEVMCSIGKRVERRYINL